MKASSSCSASVRLVASLPSRPSSHAQMLADVGLVEGHVAQHAQVGVGDLMS
jgi:hypothetical protein